jgi:hypothetical protein
MKLSDALRDHRSSLNRPIAENTGVLESLSNVFFFWLHNHTFSPG